jgi:hypothetical protein
MNMMWHGIVRSVSHDIMGYSQRNSIYHLVGILASKHTFDMPCDTGM